MIEDEGKYYLYRHIRLDLNIPFYIGIGSKRESFAKEDMEYRRAFTKDRRSNFWYNITNKTDYRIEILLESNDWDFICEKEIEFITFYGRRNLGLGPLVNLTNGGDGQHGTVVTKATREKMSKNVKERVENGTHNFLKPGYYEMIAKKLKGRKQLTSKPWSEKKKEKRTILGLTNIIYQYDKEMNFIKEWRGSMDIERELSIFATSICKCCKETNRKAGGFYWRYKKNIINE